MEPTLLDGDVLLVNRLRERPQRGDIVVFNPSGTLDGGWQVKRVIGIEGDSVSFECGLLYLNGLHHAEQYLGGLPADPGTGSRSWHVAPGECMVLGDNRAHSTDSRAWGPIPMTQIAGVASIRLWPISSRRPVRLR